MTRTILTGLVMIAAMAVTTHGPATGNQSGEAGFELAGSRAPLAMSSPRMGGTAGPVHANRSIANPAGPAEKKKKKLSLPCIKKADGTVVCPPPSPQ